jgi:hypothetical protein
LESFADEDKYEKAQNNLPDEFSFVRKKQNDTVLKPKKLGMTILLYKV